MAKVVNHTIPKKYFEKDRHSKLEAKLIPYEIKMKKGDIIRFHEIDNHGKKTGRHFDRRVMDFHKIHKATKLWKKKDLEKWGLYVFLLAEAK